MALTRATFEISGAGALTFKETPNYEMPADSNGDNVYMVTVVATDAGVDSKNKMTAERAVVVTITNVDEEGTVTLSSEQPKIGIELTATLEDPDGVVADSVKWTWHAVVENAVDDDNAIAMATSDTYTPEDTGPLSAKATYTDGEGAGKMAVGSEADVIVNLENVAPKFPDTETGMREVAEEAPAGMEINDAADDTEADPVAATDANEPNNPVLTYTLSGTDAALFDIDRGTGQLRTKAKLNYEDEDSYMVTVTATDSDGLSDSIDVTITVTDVDEAPVISEGSVAVNNAPEFASATAERSVPEDNTAAGENIGARVMATDADNDTLTYTLGGADMASFAIDPATGQIMVGADSLDFEDPADADMDNDYEVTVTASDGNMADDAMVAVTITVTNVGLADSYDADDNGVIDVDEVLNAVDDYFDDLIGVDRVLDIVDHYFAS